MKKSIFLAIAIEVAFTITKLNGQTLFVPSGTSGIGTSTVTGNVGVGISNPDSRFHIYNNLDGVLRLKIQNPNSGTSAFTQISLFNDVSGANLDVFSSNYTTAGWRNKAGFMMGGLLNGFIIATSRTIQFDNSSAITKVFFDMVSGNVGIGTTTAGSKLSFGSYIINSTTPNSSDQTSHIRLYENGSDFYGFGVSSGALNIAANQSGGALRFYTNSVERMSLDGNGDAFINGRILLNYDQRLILGYGNDINSRFEIVSSNAYKHTYIDFKKNLYFRAADQTGICPLVLQWDGSVGIGFAASYDANANQTQGYKLAVNGNILCEEVKVISDVPNSDYVFNKDYQLLKLSKLERFINANNHLPEIPSAQEFKENGYKVGEMDNLLLKKVEELTLYIIELNKKIEVLEETAKQKSR